MSLSFRRCGDLQKYTLRCPSEEVWRWGQESASSPLVISNPVGPRASSTPTLGLISRASWLATLLYNPSEPTQFQERTVSLASSFLGDSTVTPRESVWAFAGGLSRGAAQRECLGLRGQWWAADGGRTSHIQWQLVLSSPLGRVTVLGQNQCQEAMCSPHGQQRPLSQGSGTSVREVGPHSGKWDLRPRLLPDGVEAVRRPGRERLRGQSRLGWQPPLGPVHQEEGWNGGLPKAPP